MKGRMITEQEVEQALRSGLGVRFNADGQPIRVLSKEETEKAKQNWDEEYCCTKEFAEWLRRGRELAATQKEEQ